jgi:hypothetical protein
MRRLMVAALVVLAGAALEVKPLGAESNYYQRFQAAEDEALARWCTYLTSSRGEPEDGYISDSSLVDTNNLGPFLTNAPVSYPGFTSRGELAGINLGITMSEIVAVWGKPKRIEVGGSFYYGEGPFGGDLSLRFSGDRLVWIMIADARVERVRFDNGLTGMMGRAETERLLGAPALRQIDDAAASRDVKPADLPDPLLPNAPAALRAKAQCWQYIGKYAYRAGDVRTDISFKRALTPGISGSKERLLSIDVCVERGGKPFFERGGANGAQPFSADTNEAPAAAASRRSP